MRISTSQLYSQNVNALLKNQEKVSTIQNKIANGKNIISPSDDPVTSSRILALQNDKSITNTFKKSMDFANGQLELMESTFNSVTNAIMRAKQLTIQANSSALIFSDRINISVELGQLLNSITDLANTKDANGNYLFSGSKVSQPAVIIDKNGDYVFNGDNASRYIQIGTSQKVAVTESIKPIFFDVGTATLSLNSNSSNAEIAVSNSTLQNVGSLNSLDIGDLIINNIDIPTAQTDGVSEQDADKSGLAIVNAINSKISDHKVLAQVSANVVDLGTPTLGNLAAGDFTINGRQIIGNFATNQSLIDAINLETSVTGVVASDNSGQINLTATDGRNIHLITDGITAGATFANFDLNAGSGLDQVQRSGYNLYSTADIQIDGAQVSDAGLTLSITSTAANAGTATVNNLKVVSKPLTIPEHYIIKFNPLNPALNYSIHTASNPNMAVNGYDAKTFVTGEKIIIDGTCFDISGAPQAGDKFIIDVETQPSQNIFTSFKQLISAAKNNSADATELSYLLGTALDNINYFEGSILEARAKIGARMNMIADQQAANSNMNFINESSLSLLQDLDYSKAISDFSQKKVILDAAQQSFVKVQALNLFNYMK